MKRKLSLYNEMHAIVILRMRSRRATNPRLNRRLDICLEIQYHLLTATAMVLVIIALLNLQSRTSIDTMKTLIRVGSGLIALAWLLLVVWALCALKQKHSLSRLNETSSMSNGTQVSTEFSFSCSIPPSDMLSE